MTPSSSLDFVSLFRRFSQLASGMVFLAGFLVLIDGVFLTSVIKNIFPNLVAMKSNIGLTFVMAGLALWLLNRESLQPVIRSPKSSLFYPRGAKGCAWLVILMALLALGEYLFDWNLRWEGIQMSPSTSIHFFLLGTALLLINGESLRHYGMAQLLTLMVSLVSLFSFLAQIYGMTSLYGFLPYAKIALHTSAAFLTLSLGILFSRPDRGFMALVTDPHRGGALARYLLPLALVMPAAFGWLRLAAIQKGFYDTGFSLALLVTFTVAAFSLLIFLSSQSLLRADREHREAREILRRVHAQTELLLSSITSILIGVSPTGFITHWNSVAEATFGIPKESILNRPFSECGIQWDPAPILAGFQQCRSKDAPVRLADVCFKKANGVEGLLGLSIIPIQEQKSAPVQFVLFGADITERKRLEELKDEFISAVSHEMRTPLAIIREGVSQVLDGILGEVNRDQRQFLRIVLNGIDRLGRIINELLDISKIEAGKLELRREWVDLVALAKEVNSGFGLVLQKKGLVMRENFSQDKVEVSADKDKLTQVLMNLINNALKFTEQGAIEISIADGDPYVECSVSDTGRGIAQEDLPKCFSKFQQFQREPGPGEKGTGLGLAICKGIVELHKGKITVESQLGKGSKFTFILPKKDA